MEGEDVIPLAVSCPGVTVPTPCPQLPSPGLSRDMPARRDVFLLSITLARSLHLLPLAGGPRNPPEMA